MIIALLFISVLCLAYANGANDNFKATATVYGASTMPYQGALRLATVAQLAGSVASVLVAGALLKAFSGKGLVPDALVGDATFLVAVGLGAAMTVLFATRFGIPISTTHALIGGLVGGGLAMAPQELAWGALGAKYFVPLLISPLLALGLAALLYPLARFARLRMGVEATTTIQIGTRVEPVRIGNDRVMALVRTGMTLSIEQQGECSRSYTGTIAGASAQQVVDGVHKLSAFALGFARGLNDTPKVLALLVAVGWSGLPPGAALGVVAVAMAVGGLLHSRRIAETMGHKITTMNAGQAVIANGIASGLVIGASLLGSPVSTTHVSNGSIFGIGLWSGNANWRVIGGIVLAWVATLPLAALLAAVVVQVLTV